MGEIIAFKRPNLKQKQKNRTLCNSGFHKWEVVKDNPFDLKSGKLVSRYCCLRCGASRTEAR